MYLATTFWNAAATRRALRVPVGLFLLFALSAFLPGCTTMHDDLREEARSFDPIATANVPPEAHARAEEALRARNFELAKDLYQRIVAAEQDNIEARIALGEAYVGLQEGRNALTIYDTLPEAEQETPQVMEGQGLALLIEGRGAEAVEPLRGAVEQDPSRWRAWNALGLYHDSRAEWQEAEENYRAGIEANAETPILHNNLGYSLLLQGRPEEAEAAFNQALTLSPGLDVARSNLRLALAAQGRYTAALSGTRREDLATVLNNVGYLAMIRGDYDAAQTYLSRAVDASPRYFPAAHENLDRLSVLSTEQSH